MAARSCRFKSCFPHSLICEVNVNDRSKIQWPYSSRPSFPLDVLPPSAAILPVAVGTGCPGESASVAETAKADGKAKSHKHVHGEYSGECLDHVAFPMGGIGAGMICLEDSRLRTCRCDRRALGNEPCTFAAISIAGTKKVARVLEGPVPARKRFGMPGAGFGDGDSTHGLPRFASAMFKARFPFGEVTLTDNDIPLAVEITGWSPLSLAMPIIASLPSQL